MSHLRHVPAWALLLAFVVLADPAAAHNGEYVAPESLRKPPSVSPRTGPGKTTGTPSTTPDAMPKPKGVPTPGSLKGKTRATAPDAVRREASISWELAWELVRDREPIPPKPMADETMKSLLVALRKALADPNDSVKTRAVLALGRAGHLVDATEAIRHDLDLNRGVALMAPGLAVGSWSTADDREEVVAALDLVLSNPDAPIEAKIVSALGMGLAGPPAANALIEALADKPSDILRRTCLFALGLTGHPGARDLLVPEILPPDPKSDRPDDSAYRALMVHALSRVPGTESGADLLRCLGDPSSRVRTAAALSLSKRLGGVAGARAALRDLARRGNPRPRSAALLALTLGGDDQAAGLARSAIRDPAVRGTGLPALGAFCLGYVRSAADGKGLVDLAANQGLDGGLRCAAALAAGLVRARGEGERLAAVLKQAKDPDLIGYVLIGVALIDPERATTAIRKRWRREDRPRVRYLMAQALGHCGGEKAVERLIEALGDTYFVNREAAVSLFRIAPDRAGPAVLARLGNEKNAFARRFATVVLGRVLDRRKPTFFAETLLGTGLDTDRPIPRMFLYLEREYLFQRR
jgi:HEAT repeat protein